MEPTPNTIVISLGGSLIVPDEVDVQFLKDFQNFILTNLAKGTRFILITGGGKICRRYQAALTSIHPDATHDDLDWIGIASLRLNAELVRTVLIPNTHDRVLNHPDEFKGFDKPVFVCGAYEPGKSSDFDAVHFAEVAGAKKVINLSNIEYAYTADPKTNPDAKRLEHVTWAEYRSYIPKEWSPGLNTPFDPIASERAEKAGIEVAIMGKNLENLQSYIDGKAFIGTTIK